MVEECIYFENCRFAQWQSEVFLIGSTALIERNDQIFYDSSCTRVDHNQKEKGYTIGLGKYSNSDATWGLLN